MRPTLSPEVTAFFDQATNTVSYVVRDPGSAACAIINSVLDYGTARCDFPGGSAETLWESIQKVLSLPDTTRLFMCHDYKAPGRDEFGWQTTVAEQKSRNIHIAGKTKRDFVNMRTARDATLGMPKLIIPSIQVNMRAGRMPPPEDNGTTYLKVPENKL